MMKKKKQGFTLVELLICLAIMAIVTTMGLTIAKGSINNAYNEYFYNGYTTITKLLEEANYKESIATDGTKYTTRDKFYENIVKKYLTLKSGSSASNFTTTSNITYKISSNFKSIEMIVPQAKNKETPFGKAIITLYYDKELTPYPIPTGGDFNINLAKRVDLLPCYIEDGEQGWGEVCADDTYNDGNPKYKSCTVQHKAPKYISLQDALCTTVSDPFIATKLGGCNTDYNADKKNMVIKFVRPSKAHH